LAWLNGLVCFPPDVERLTRFIGKERASFWAVLPVDAALRK
jgi:hypothetical protein